MFVLTEALQIWPSASIKMNYVAKLLQANTSLQLDPPPALVTGLDILQRVMEVQPQKAVQVRACSCSGPCTHAPYRTHTGTW